MSRPPDVVSGLLNPIRKVRLLYGTLKLCSNCHKEEHGRIRECLSLCSLTDESGSLRS